MKATAVDTCGASHRLPSQATDTGLGKRGIPEDRFPDEPNTLQRMGHCYTPNTVYEHPGVGGLAPCLDVFFWTGALTTGGLLYWWLDSN